MILSQVLQSKEVMKARFINAYARLKESRG